MNICNNLKLGYINKIHKLEKTRSVLIKIRKQRYVDS